MVAHSGVDFQWKVPGLVQVCARFEIVPLRLEKSALHLSLCLCLKQGCLSSSLVEALVLLVLQKLLPPISLWGDYFLVDYQSGHAIDSMCPMGTWHYGFVGHDPTNGDCVVNAIHAIPNFAMMATMRIAMGLLFPVGLDTQSQHSHSMDLVGPGQCGCGRVVEAVKRWFPRHLLLAEVQARPRLDDLD